MNNSKPQVRAANEVSQTGLQTYIGTKIVQAEPMDRRSFHQNIRPFVGWSEDCENEPGYKVMYSDGYVSWSPEGIFRRSYRLLTSEEKTLMS